MVNPCALFRRLKLVSSACQWNTLQSPIQRPHYKFKESLCCDEAHHDILHMAFGVLNNIPWLALLVTASGRVTMIHCDYSNVDIVAYRALHRATACQVMHKCFYQGHGRDFVPHLRLDSFRRGQGHTCKGLKRLRRWVNDADMLAEDAECAFLTQHVLHRTLGNLVHCRLALADSVGGFLVSKGLFTVLDDFGKVWSGKLFIPS